MRNHGPPDDGQAYENGPGCELGQTYEFERTYEFEQINKTAAISECLCETALSRKGLTPTIALTGMFPPTTALTGMFLYRARWTAFLGSTGRGFAGLSRPSAIWKWGQRKKYVGKNKVLALRYGNARHDEDLLPDDSCGKF